MIKYILGQIIGIVKAIAIVVLGIAAFAGLVFCAGADDEVRHKVIDDGMAKLFS